MTSCGQAMTQPAQPVHSPLVTTSSYSSFHCAVQRVRVGAASVTVMTAQPTAPIPLVLHSITPLGSDVRCRPPESSGGTGFPTSRWGGLHEDEEARGCGHGGRAAGVAGGRDPSGGCRTKGPGGT